MPFTYFPWDPLDQFFQSLYWHPFPPLPRTKHYIVYWFQWYQLFVYVETTLLNFVIFFSISDPQISHHIQSFYFLVCIQSRTSNFTFSFLPLQPFSLVSLKSTIIKYNTHLFYSSMIKLILEFDKYFVITNNHNIFLYFSHRSYLHFMWDIFINFTIIV